MREAHFSTARRFAALLPAVLLSACGYMGEPLPPALKRPVPVTDLTAVERGPKIMIRFTVPKITTEDLPVTKPDLELRIGAVGDTFHAETWLPGTERITAIQEDAGIAKAEIPVSKYEGKNIVIGVNVHGPGGRTAGWSNFVPLTVVPPLPKPTGLTAKNGPDAVLLSWQGGAPAFRVFRKTVEAPDWTRIGVSEKPEYADAMIEYGKTFQYYVQGEAKAGGEFAESEDSDVTTFKPVDTFPPAVPTGLTVAPGARSMELVWDRNAEKDFARYRIYRDGKPLPETVSTPAYSDREVQPKTKYQYQISAIDAAGNESALCEAVSSEIP